MGLLIAGGVRANNYYVSPDGNDLNDGSAATPFRTLMQGALAAGPGDNIIVRDGTYGPENAVTEGDGANTNHSPVTLIRSGTASAWITFMAEHKWGAILDCQLQCDSYFNLSNASYIVIQDFVITRGFSEGIHSNETAHHISLQGNRIEYIANRPSSTANGLVGIYTNQSCHDFFIQGNVFHDIGRTNIDWLDHALYLHGSNFTITNNIFYNLTRGWAIQMADGLTNVTVMNNTFAFANPNRNGHIIMWNTQSGVTIQNNIFYSPRNYAITRFQSAVASCTIDHNLVYGATGVMVDSSGCALGTNTMNADPAFVNAASPPYDFHLQAGSPAIASGISTPIVSFDPDGALLLPGATTDVGAFPFTP
jgi:hypothetical protein